VYRLSFVAAYAWAFGQQANRPTLFYLYIPGVYLYTYGEIIYTIATVKKTISFLCTLYS